MKKNIIFLIIIICVLLMPNRVFAQEVLFSVPYGKQAGQVYMYIPDPNLQEQGDASGPGWFFVDIKHDVVYVDLQKYKTNGEFIGKIKYEENQPFSGIRTCSWVDSEENVYVSGFSDLHNNSNQIAKTNKDGSMIWSKSLQEIVAHNKSYEDIARGINVDDQENIYLEVWYRANPQNQSAETKYLKLDQNGSLLGEVPSFHLDKDGNYYVFNTIYSTGNLYAWGEKYAGDYKSGADISILNPEKQFHKKLKISLPADFMRSNNYRGVYQWEVDLKGNIYVAAFVIRDPDKMIKLLDDVFLIPDDYFVYKFDRQGKLVSQFMFPGYPVDLNKKDPRGRLPERLLSPVPCGQPGCDEGQDRHNLTRSGYSH